MSIPIKDISAGDTVSSMVDKINYNFDLLSLKGGGPAGIQGIQGIRGAIGLQGEVGQQGDGGSMIYDVYPDPATADNYNYGDMTLYGSTFYLLKDINGTKTWYPVLNIASQIETPFVGSEYGTINPKISTDPNHDYSMDTFVLGENNESIWNATIAMNTYKSAFVISGKHFGDNNTKYHISLIGVNGAYDTHDGYIYIDYEGGYPVMKLEGGNGGSVRIVGNNRFIDVGNEITLSNRSAQIGSNNGAVVTTDNNGNVTSNVDWIVSGTDSSLFPRSNFNLGQNINENRIGDIYVKQGSQINILDANYNTNDSFFKVTYKGLNNSARDICAMSSYGVSFGINSNLTNLHFDEVEHFGIRVGNTSREPANYQKSKPPYFALVTTSITNRIVIGESLTLTANAINVLKTTSPNTTATYSMSLSSDYNDEYIKKHYAPLITAVVGANAKKEKHSGNTLWISGADSDVNSPSEGKDVVITGGNTFGGAIGHVGGTVFISGGNAISNITSLQSGATGDLRRMGNIIMGINPFNHKNMFNNNVYAANAEYDKLTGTNPEGVKFFDINDIAMHANRIVIDSNANYRKAVYGAIADSTANEFNGPYVEKPELSTVQVSGINTLKTSNPVILKKSECCEHQFLSGIMSQVFKLKYSESLGFTVTKTVFSNTHALESDSIYFVVNQVWQKVGNVVNVNLRAEWLAYGGSTQSNPNGLFHVSDYMFGYTNNGDNDWEYPYYSTPFSIINDPGFTKWWEYQLLNSSANYFRFTAKNAALSKIISGKTSFEEQLENNLLRRLYNSIYPNYHNSWQTDNAYNISSQPICVFQIPISIENCYVSSIQGSGNVGTEGINGYFSKSYSNYTNEMPYNDMSNVKPMRKNIDGQWVDSGEILRNMVRLNPSNSLAESGNLIVGDWCLKHPSDGDWGKFGNTTGFNVVGQNGTYKGMKGVYHGINGEYYSLSSTQPTVNSNTINDDRMSMQQDSTTWNENKFITPTLTNNKYTYFYPQKLTQFGNVSYHTFNFNDTSKKNVYTPHECYRPVIGLFTTMNINYSYVIIPKLGDNFVGMSYYQPDSNTAQGTSADESTDR